jgi:DNA-binding Lrp family transcriptional regulator
LEVIGYSLLVIGYWGADRPINRLNPSANQRGQGMLTELEKKVVASIQKDIPVTERPYLKIARELRISEAALLQCLQELCDRGIIRRFGATLRHQKTGYTANAMAAWQVEEARVEVVGSQMAAFKQVSHCYRRNPTAGWPYNLYTMIHANDMEACREIARQMAQQTQVDDYTLLFSRRELKKTSMVYSPSDEDD